MNSQMAVGFLLEKGMNANQVPTVGFGIPEREMDSSAQAKIELDKLEVRVIRSCEILRNVLDVAQNLV